MPQNLFTLEHKILKELQILYDTPERHEDGTIMKILPTAIKAYSRLLKESERIVTQNDKMMAAQRKRLAKKGGDAGGEKNVFADAFDDREIENIDKNNQVKISPRIIMALDLVNLQYASKDLDWSLWKELFDEFIELVNETIKESDGIIHNFFGNHLYIYWAGIKEEKTMDVIRVVKKLLNVCTLLSNRHKSHFSNGLFLARASLTCDCFRATLIGEKERKFYSLFGERWHILPTLCANTKDYEFSFDHVYYNFMPEDIELTSIAEIEYCGEKSQLYNYYI